MCFVLDDVDYDWIAQGSRTETGPAPVRVRCDECRQLVHPGEWRRAVTLIQYDECRYCQMDPAEAFPDHDPDDDGPYPERDCVALGHDFGETSTTVTCERCEAVREGVRAVELAAGCRSWEAVPPDGQMDEFVRAGEGWDHYAQGMRALGLARAAELVRLFDAPDDHEDLWFRMAYDARCWARWLPGEYPNAHCGTHAGQPLTGWDDLGGEG